MYLSKKGLIPVFLLATGIVIGAIITSAFRLPPFGQATAPTIESRPLPVISSPVEQLFVDVSKMVTPAVVNISTTRVIKGDDEDFSFSPFFNDPFFRRFFGEEPFRRPRMPKQRREQSLGSGVIVDPTGYIITNNHVVSKADEIKVVLSDRREFKGKIVGTDPKSDIAVIKIDGDDLPTMRWGNSTQLEVGEYVLAIGNPFGLNQTVTMGIISAVGRAQVGIADYEDFIQTDAAINPGNSGGALVNVHGELIGINTAIFTRSGGYMGIGFAVPSDMAKSVMDSLIATGKVVRGWLGISIQEITAKLAKEFGLVDSRGTLVADVLPDSPAERGGLQRGDIILELNGKEIRNTGQLRNVVAATPVGSKITLKVFRDKQSREIAVTIDERPQDIDLKERTDTGAETSSVLKGVEVRNITPEIARELDLPRDQTGVVIVQVEPGSTADEAGLQRGDVIIEVNRIPVTNTKEYGREVSKIKKENSALFLISRQGRTIFMIIGLP